MALPKVKLSKSKKGRRRSHLALALVQIQPCPNCKHPRRPHSVCPNCGHYGPGSGREVLKAALLSGIGKAQDHDYDAARKMVRAVLNAH